MSERAIPRIAPLEQPYPPDIEAQFAAIMRGAPPLVLFRVLAKYRRTWDKFCAASLLDKGALTLRQREIVIDRTCALNGCEYEWGVHVTAFAEAAGLSDEEIAATVQGCADAARWSAAEWALLCAVDALHHRATLTSEEFGALATHYDEPAIFEIIMLCGFYRTVSYLANGLNLPLEPNAARFPR